MKLLLLLTATFPFDSGEEFLENELRYARGFDRVLVCPCNLKEGSRQTRRLPEGVECLRVRRIPGGKTEYGTLLRLACVRGELRFLLRSGRFSAARVHEMLFFMKQAVSICRALRREPAIRSADEVTIYSYWFYDAAAAGALLKDLLILNGRKAELVSRAHGFDLHEERSPHQYLPMREYLMKSVRSVFPCSEEGAELLRSRFPQYAGKVHPAHLGTRDVEFRGGSRTPFHVASCSYMVPVKRLHLIVESLQKADFPVRWTHIGSGPLEAELRKQAERLPDCVEAVFPGAMKNQEVLHFYQTHHITAFLNVSSSEGIPVSIMEACSFGLPVIATDVGGTDEIVKDGENGFLLRADFSPEELLQTLRRIGAMSKRDYQKLCGNSRSIWEKSFSAGRNYPEFYEVLSDETVLPDFSGRC